MCKAMEEMRRAEREEGREQGREEVARSLLADRALPIEQIAKYAKLSLEEVKRLAEESDS